MSKSKEEAKPVVLLGRPSNNVSIGIVGMPNIGKCWAAGTQLYRADGSLVAVEHVQEGDALMGDDSTPRVVQKGSATHGTAPMYTVTPRSKCAARPFTVNGAHILVLRRGKTESVLPVDDFLRLSAEQRRQWRCFHSRAVEFTSARGCDDFEQPITAAQAYDCGRWLACGSVEAADPTALCMQLLSEADEKQVRAQLWLTQGVDVRRQFIAGFVDAQTSAESAKSASASPLLCTCRPILEALSTIALSCGAVPSAITERHLVTASSPSVVYCMSIRSAATVDSSDAEYEFDVVPQGPGEYYGFTVNGNHRLLLRDFTVTHNSSLFNCLSNLNVPAENYPFCTIDPSNARVPVPDSRFDFLCDSFKPASKMPAVLTITDIAGLVKGANEGKGLGNAFLSHIQAVDAIYHLVRAFKDKEIEHVEGSVDPIRDLDIIAEELILKDHQRVKDRLEVVTKAFQKAQDKSKKQDMATLTTANQLLEEKKDIRSGAWKPDDIDVLNELQLLTAKPVVYLVNIGEDEYYQQKNKWLGKIKEWVVKRDPAAKVIPFSVVYEAKLTALPDDAARKALSEEKKVPSQLPKIITTGYHALDLVHYFTAGEDEVRAWTVKRGTLAPAAAGVIHTDFQKAFIAAEVYSFDDFKECGSEAAVKAAGKMRTKGKEYVTQDGDVMFFKHNAGGAKKK